MTDDEPRDEAYYTRPEVMALAAIGCKAALNVDLLDWITAMEKTFGGVPVDALKGFVRIGELIRDAPLPAEKSEKPAEDVGREP